MTPGDCNPQRNLGDTALTSYSQVRMNSFRILSGKGLSDKEKSKLEQILRGGSRRAEKLQFASQLCPQLVKQNLPLGFLVLAPGAQKLA